MITLTALEFWCIFVVSLIALSVWMHCISVKRRTWSEFLLPIWIPYVVFYIPLSLASYFKIVTLDSATPLDVISIGGAVSLGYVTAAAIRGWRVE